MAVSRAHAPSGIERNASFATALRPAACTAAVVAALILMSSLFGIAARSAGLLAAIWPTSAVLLGAMVRWPALASPAGWLVAAIGLLLADFAAAGSFGQALWMALADFVGIVTGYLLFLRLDPADRRLERPMSLLHLVVVVVAASAAAGIVGVVASPLLSLRSPLVSWGAWLANDLVNYVTILPVILTLPVGAFRLVERRRSATRVPVDRERVAPLVAVVLSCAAGLFIGGPGAIAFPVPALLWCALTYSLFATAAMTLLFSMWTLAAISLGHVVGFVDHESQHSLMSIRIGVSLMALAPITVASVMAVRNVLLRSLLHLASHDPLTGLLNRRAFVEQGAAELAAATQAQLPVSVLMLDIDHFKSINDTYGHSTGDHVLTSCASTLRTCLRDGDLIGRLGGEEFAVLLAGCTGEQAEPIAERVRAAVAAAVVDLNDGRRVMATVSIGIAATGTHPSSLEQLLCRADAALYRAKSAGRNRIVNAEAIASTCRPQPTLL